MCQEGKLFRGNVTATSTIASDLGTPGEKRIESDGNIYRLFKAGATLPLGALLMLDSVSASVGHLVEGAHQSRLVPLKGVWTQSVSLASDAYFFGLVQGTFQCRGSQLDSSVDLTLNAALMLNADKRLAAIASNSSASIIPQVFGQLLGASLGNADHATTVSRAVFIDCQGA